MQITKKFKIFWNLNVGYFPLEIIDNGKLDYPNYDDYITIYKELEPTPKSICFLTRDSFAFVDNLKVNTKNKIKEFFFKPLVRKASVGLISFALALSMAGCSQASTKQEEQDKIKQEEESKYYTETVEPTIEEAKNNGFDIEYNEKLGDYFVKSYFNEKLDKEVIFVNDLKELRKYFPEENQNPTYEDLHNEIDNNPEIEDDVKEKFHEILKNLENRFPNFDLFLLNYNIKRMRTYTDTFRDYNDESKSEDSLATFDPETEKTKFKYRNLPLKVYGHECTHAATAIRLELNENTIIIFCIYPVVYRSYNGGTAIRINGSEEGFCNLVAFAGCNFDKYDPEGINTYVELTEGMSMIYTSIGWSLEDVVNSNPIKLLEAMQDKCGIEDSLETLSVLTELDNRRLL